MSNQVCTTVSKSDMLKPLSWVYSNLFLISLLIIINLLCFGRTLNGYFLADDFIHIPYLARVFEGHPELLLQNFYSNWMQTAGTQFYRPFISITLAADYFFWHANAVGYHITNTFYQILNTVFLFLLSRRILKEYGQGKASLAAFFVAALFAANPLHTEVVSWVIGRVDSVCSAFLLGSFWLFLKGIQDKSKTATIAAPIFFVLSLLSKEMAITLPPVLTVCLIFTETTEDKWTARIKNAFKSTWIFWAILLCYFGIRTLALGTISGGYTGSIGEGLSTSFIKRWFQDRSMLLVFYPFNAEVFSPHNNMRKTLHFLYLLAGLSIFVRLGLKLIFKQMQTGFSKYILFAVAWFIISMAPTYQVFNITDTLQSSRFIYLGTAPLCLLLVVLVFPLFVEDSKFKTIQKYLYFVALALLSCLVACYTSITYKNNLPWAHAGAEVRTLRLALEKTVEQLPPNKTLVLMNLPQRLQGAHMLYNAAMLSILLSPPLSAPNISSRVATFEPMTYGDSDLLNTTRFRKLAAQPKNYAFYRWNSEKKKLEPLHLNSTFQKFSLPLPNGVLSINQPKSQQYLFSPYLNLDSAGIDFVTVTVSGVSRATKDTQYLCLFWLPINTIYPTPESSLCEPLILDGKSHTYTFAVSQYKKWMLSGKLNQIALLLPPGNNYQLYDISFSNGIKQIPAFTADPKTIREALDGICYLLSTYGDFNYDASKLPNASGVAIEISKPNSWFEHYSGQLRDQQLSANALHTKFIKETHGCFRLHASDLPMDGYYQLRLAGINSSGKMIGYLSDPINLQISAAQITADKLQLHTTP